MELTDLEVDVMVLEVVYRSAPMYGRTDQTVPQTLILFFELVPNERRHSALGLIPELVVGMSGHLYGEVSHLCLHSRVDNT